MVRPCCVLCSHSAVVENSLLLAWTCCCSFVMAVFVLLSFHSEQNCTPVFVPFLRSHEVVQRVLYEKVLPKNLRLLQEGAAQEMVSVLSPYPPSSQICCDCSVAPQPACSAATCCSVQRFSRCIAQNSRSCEQSREYSIFLISHVEFSLASLLPSWLGSDSI